MAKGKQPKKVYVAQAHYLRDETKPFIVAALLIDIATEHSKDAKDRYQRIVDAWARPGCQAVLKDKLEIPRGDIIGWFEAAETGMPWKPTRDFVGDLIQRHRNASDMKHLEKAVVEFIEHSFNRKPAKKAVTLQAASLSLARTGTPAISCIPAEGELSNYS